MDRIGIEKFNDKVMLKLILAKQKLKFSYIYFKLFSLFSTGNHSDKPITRLNVHQHIQTKIDRNRI